MVILLIVCFYLSYSEIEFIRTLDSPSHKIMDGAINFFRYLKNYWIGQVKEEHWTDIGRKAVAAVSPKLVLINIIQLINNTV